MMVRPQDHIGLSLWQAGVDHCGNPARIDISGMGDHAAHYWHLLYRRHKFIQLAPKLR